MCVNILVYEIDSSLIDFFLMRRIAEVGLKGLEKVTSA